MANAPFCMLHVLLHMARRDEPLTSEQIAQMLETNPVVVRRTMAGLRETGYVRSEKGHGGGWTIACDLKRITLLDIHRAVGGPRIFAIGNETESPECAVERVVNAALDDALRQAEALLLERLATVALVDLAADCDLPRQRQECPGPAARTRLNQPLVDQASVMRSSAQ